MRYDLAMNNPVDVIRRLREHAFHVSAADLELSPTPDRPHVWCAIMELGYPTGIATLLSFAEGTTSLYFSNGGGVVGAGEHESVRAAAEVFLDAVEAHRAGLSPVEETPTPRIGRVRFYARTFEGTFGAEATEDQLGQKLHPLSPVFFAGHAVITAIRESSEP
ncbi:MAG TPA: hypothetical protein VFX78_02425 [Candidatus Eisenbacteria bacterium]|jgi:hypothetical protein|nr:hypothetical protein [Candidatus Eisenbacteria bacterium]